jgi:hypothetical protein
MVLFSVGTVPCAQYKSLKASDGRQGQAQPLQYSASAVGAGLAPAFGPIYARTPKVHSIVPTIRS